MNGISNEKNVISNFMEILSINCRNIANDEWVDKKKRIFFIFSIHRINNADIQSSTIKAQTLQKQCDWEMMNSQWQNNENQSQTL